RGGVVVVVLEDVAEGGHGLLVAVSEIETDDLEVRRVRSHPHREAADIDVTVIAHRPCDFGWSPAIEVRREGRLCGIVGAADAKSPTGAIGDQRATVAMVKVEQTV